MAAPIRVGTCSWADEALTKYWYPKGVPSGARLGFYAEHFDTVEVDSTYYRLPVEEMVERWAERTPDGFVMHVKAFGVMTRHPVKVEQLPPDLRDEAPRTTAAVDRPSREFRAEIFRRFREALEPLRAAGKLGGLLFQFPPYVVPKEASFDYLAWARDQVEDDKMLVEFRHRTWDEGHQREETLPFLEELGTSHVVVDAPRSKANTVPPTAHALTTPVPYVRLHGRNAGTWNVRGGSAAERFDHLSSEESWRTGSTRCSELRSRRNRRSRCSTTTAAAASVAARSRKRRRTPRCSGICSRRTGCRSARRLQELEQHPVETPPARDPDDVAGARRRLRPARAAPTRRQAGLVDREDVVPIAGDDHERAGEPGDDVGRVRPVAERLHPAHELVGRAIWLPRRRESRGSTP